MSLDERAGPSLRQGLVILASLATLWVGLGCAGGPARPPRSSYPSATAPVKLDHATHVFEGHAGAVHAVAFSFDGTWLATGGEDHYIRVWNLQAIANPHTLAGHTEAITALAFTRDGQLLISASEDDTIRLWEVASWRQVGTMAGEAGGVTSIALGPSNEWLVSGSADGKVTVWNLKNKTVMRSFLAHATSVASVAVHPSGSQFASAGADGNVVLWAVLTGDRVWNFRDEHNSFSCAAFSPDGKILAVGDAGGRATLLNSANGDLVRRLGGNMRRVNGIVFDRSGGQLGMAGADNFFYALGIVEFWDVFSSARKFERISAHARGTLGIAISPDGNWLATTSEDGTTKLWDSQKWRVSPPGS